MKLASLSSACEIIMGQAPSGDTYNDEGEGLPLIAGAGDFGEMTPSPAKFTSKPTKVSKAGDIILCIRATIGDLNWSDSAYCLGRGVAALRPYEGKASPRYIWHAVEANAGKLAGLGRGATFKQVSREDISDLQIPLPPLDKQERIAAILDQADAVYRLRQQSLNRLGDLSRSLFNDMFGDPLSNPKKWPLAECGSVCERITVGIVVKPASYYRPKGVPAIRGTNIKANGIDLRDVVYFSQEDNERTHAKTRVWKDDLVIVRSGRPGLAAVVPESLNGVNSIDVLIVTPSRGKVRSRFLRDLINSTGGRRIVLSESRGQVQQHFNVGSLSDAKLIVPPVEVQDAYERILDVVEKQTHKLSVGTEQTHRLFRSLQHRAFRGEL